MSEKEFLDYLSKGVFAGETFDMDTDLIDFKRWDSIAVVSFIASMNTDFNIVLNPLDVDTVNTVGELYELVQEAGE